MSESEAKGAENAKINGSWHVFNWQSWQRHLLFVVAAIATGATAWFFWFAEDRSTLCFERLRSEAPLSVGGWEVPHWLSSTVLPMALVTFGMLLIMQLRIRFFPGTEGTGIPQAIAALKTEDGPIRKRMLSWKIAVGKTGLLLLGLFSGMTIGREGPSVHVGACFMYLITKITRFPQHLVQRGLILGGGGAGIAAAFNAPIAGTIFAMEEIGRSFEKKNIGTLVRTVLVACLVVVLLRGEDYLFYGEVKLNAGKWPLKQWLAVPIIGGIGGLLGGLFARAVVAGSKAINRWVVRRRVLVPLALGASLAVIGWISDGHSYGSGYTEAQEILMNGTDYAWHYAPLKALANFFCLISGIPGGLFDPSLSVGAGLGQTFHPIMEQWFPELSGKAVIMMFMVAYFAGVVQSPITCAVIMLEMTAARFMAIPLLAVAIIAYECSHRVCPTAIYEALAEIFLGTVRKEHSESTE